MIEVYIEEYFDNDLEDDMVIPEIIEPDTTQPYIDGPQFVKPFDTDVVFSIVNSTGGEFVVNSSKVKIIESNETSCVLEILTGKSAKFDLIYKIDGVNDIVLPVTIQSL